MLRLWIILADECIRFFTQSRESAKSALRARDSRAPHALLDRSVIRANLHEEFSHCTILMELTGRRSAIRFVLNVPSKFRQQAKLISERIHQLQKSGDRHFNPPSPRFGYHVKKIFTDWKIYRTRFLVRAQQLDQALSFTDALGREHRGRIGDYLVESADGTRSITPRAIFEDIYVVMGNAGELDPSANERRPPGRGKLNAALKRRSSLRTASA